MSIIIEDGKALYEFGAWVGRFCTNKLILEESELLNRLRVVYGNKRLILRW